MSEKPTFGASFRWGAGAFLGVLAVGCLLVMLACGGCFVIMGVSGNRIRDAQQRGMQRARQQAAREKRSAKPPTSAAKTNENPPFDDGEMVRPLNQISGYAIDDYTTLPNCLDVFQECVVIPFEGKTSEQYKAATLEIARKPCRVVLKLVNVSADYDFAEFELLNDDGEPATDVLHDAGDLGNYTRHIRATFPINGIKAKGLDSKRLSPGDRVVLVGLGYVVPASPWGATTATHGVPRGDNRYVMLRAFGQPNRYTPYWYEFAFMVRNWYIASQ